jgi:hypothetical protein
VDGRGRPVENGMRPWMTPMATGRRPAASSCRPEQCGERIVAQFGLASAPKGSPCRRSMQPSAANRRQPTSATPMWPGSFRRCCRSPCLSRCACFSRIGQAAVHKLDWPPGRSIPAAFLSAGETPRYWVDDSRLTAPRLTSPVRAGPAPAPAPAQEPEAGAERRVLAAAAGVAAGNRPRGAPSEP